MKHKSELPRYLMIALDIAYRIEREELKEGQKLRGRSMLSSEYNVSPETIRRATTLLEDQGVLTIIDKSGIIIKNKEKATHFINQVSDKKGLQTLNQQMMEVIQARKVLDIQLEEYITELIDLSTKIKSTNHFINHEVVIPENSHLHEKTIGELSFWHHTNATIIGIERKNQLFVSPGPQFKLQAFDRITFVCLEENYYKTKTFIES
jgi:K+/H+ antiporter YhaU regulatory subunit KhtT